MKLNVKERLMLLNILPAENDFVTLKIVRNLQEDLSFNEKEVKEFEFKQEDKKMFWNNSKDIEKDIQIGEKATDIIIEALKKANNEKKLTLDLMSVYEKFIK